ncbi:hypothetical protein TNCV_4881351 [Trichonephila clavipes]|nr:hypothetical protein TNCV_4881351 [Trichonephila clavipes]
MGAYDSLNQESHQFQLGSNPQLWAYVAVRYCIVPSTEGVGVFEKRSKILTTNKNLLSDECTMRYDRALRHTSSVGCLETFLSIFAVPLPLVRSNSWDAPLAIQNDLRYARLETTLRIMKAKEG